MPLAMPFCLPASAANELPQPPQILVADSKVACGRHQHRRGIRRGHLGFWRDTFVRLGEAVAVCIIIPP
ncbi:MAG: hypothetical protein ACLUEQ_07350 [Cloacibacillus evryensis]